MAPEDDPLGQCHGKDKPSSSSSRTSSSCYGAALTFVGTAPRLLRNTPASLPIGEPRIAVVRLRRCSAPTALVGATFAMHPTAPLFLRYRPTCLPVREAIGAIVWICRPRRRQDGHRRRHDGHRRRHDGHRRRSCWWAPTVMNPTAPRLLVCRPSVLRVDCAVEGVNRSPRRSRWSRRRRGRRRGGLRWERCWRNCRRGLGQSSGRAAPAHSHAAIVLLCL